MRNNRDLESYWPAAQRFQSELPMTLEGHELCSLFAGGADPPIVAESRESARIEAILKSVFVQWARRFAGDKAVRTVIDIKFSTSSMSRGTRRFPHGAYSGPVDWGASLPGPHRAENEPPTQGDNQLVSTSVLSVTMIHDPACPERPIRGPLFSVVDTEKGDD